MHNIHNNRQHTNAAKRVTFGENLPFKSMINMSLRTPPSETNNLQANIKPSKTSTARFKKIYYNNNIQLIIIKFD